MTFFVIELRVYRVEQPRRIWLIMQMRGAEWVYSADLGVWVMRIFPESEDGAKRLGSSLAQWSPGKYTGDDVVPYRTPAHGAA